MLPFDECLFDLLRQHDAHSSSKNTPLRVLFSTLFSVFGYPDETLSLVFDFYKVAK